MNPLQPTAAPAHPLEEQPAALGERLRRLRRARRRTLRAVADAAAVSESFLSQVERGVANPSISSLTRVATALGVSVHDLFAPARADGSHVVRAGDGPPLEFGEGARKWLLTPQPLQELEVCVCVYDVGGHSGAEPYVHGDAEELCVVLDGTVEHTVGGDLHRLAEGDAASYRSSQPHRTVNVGDTPARVLYALTPPTF
jgi:transcriptional regulator with XRE-family HTH domain